MHLVKGWHILCRKENTIRLPTYGDVAVHVYCYANGNDLVSFNITNDKTRSTLTEMYIEIVISKPTTTSVWVRKR